MKRCPRCGYTKLFAEFPRNRSQRDGLGNYCKPCHVVVVKKNREKNHGSHRNYLMALRYKIDSQKADQLLAAQGNVCPVCGSQQPGHVDHCHGTGEVRGILCFNCNGGLGRFEDDAVVMARAADYLSTHRQESS